MHRNYLHLVVLRAFDVLVLSMVLEVLVHFWHSELFQFGRILTQIFPSIIDRYRLFPLFSGSPSPAPLLSSSF